MNRISGGLAGKILRVDLSSKKISTEDTEPSYSKKPTEYEITDESIALGKFLGERPLESVGISKAEKEIGVTMKIGKPVDITSNIIKNRHVFYITSRF